MKQLLRLVAFAFGLAIASSMSHGQQAPNNPITAPTQPCSDVSHRIVNTQFINNCVFAIGHAVSEVDTGTGLTGGPITTTGTIALANIAGVAGTYTTPNLTVNGQGQITTIASSTVAGFPFTLGSTTINAGATVTTVSGLTLAGPTITGFLGGAPNFSGVPIFSGLSPGVCANNITLDAGQHLVTGGCPIAGPGSSVANHVITFADASGHLAADSGILASSIVLSTRAISTSPPLSGGGSLSGDLTLSLTGPSNLTTFTSNVIPKGAGASPFAASSLTDNGTTVSTGEQIVSTLASGTAPFVVASTTLVANLNAAQLGGATFAAPGAIGGTTPAAASFSSLLDTGMSGTGVRCVHVDNTGALSVAAGDCAAGGSGSVVSVATTAPISGGTITTTGTISITGPSNLTTFTTSAIPKGAGASAFVASSLVDNGTTVTTAEQIVSTLVTGTAPFSVASTTNVANLNASSLAGATFAAPGPIGSGTASTGAFTTLSASSTISGAAFTTFFASPPAIGGTAAAAGSFTTLSASGQITSTVSTGTAPLVIASTTNVANLNASSLSGATFAAPGPIGSTTPSTGAFTTLSATSTVNGAGITALFASPPAIGGTAAAAGSFTTLAASSTVSGPGFSTYLASPPAIGSTAAGTGAFTTLSASSTVTLSGLGAGTCSSGISINASNQIVKIACPGGGGTVTSVGLGPGLTATIGSQNVTPIGNAGTINLQLWPTPKSSGSPYTLVAADTGNLIQANAGTFAFKLPNPAAGTKGTIYQLNDELGNGFTATTVTGTALLYGSPNTAAGVAVTATLGVNSGLSCIDDGTNYACQESPGLASPTIFGVVKPDNVTIFTTAGVLSAHDTVATGLTAAGTTQATALQLTSTFNVVTSVAAGAGVALQSCSAGRAQYVRNSGANDLLVYTKNGDSAVINSLATTAGQTVPPNTTAFYEGTTTTQCYSIP